MDGGVVEIKRTDWSAILSDLRAEGWSVTKVAETFNLPRTTVQSWRDGAIPNADAGIALLRLHRLVIMGRPIRPAWAIRR